MDKTGQSNEDDNLDHLYDDVSVKKKNDEPLISSSTFTETVLFTVFAAYISFAFVKKISPIFFSNMWLNAFIILLTFIGIIHFFISISKIRNAENIFRGLIKPAGYEEESCGDKSALITHDIHSFFSLTDNVTQERGQRLSHAFTLNLYHLKNPLKYLGYLVLSLGFLGTFWELLQILLTAKDTLQASASPEGSGGIETILAAMSVAFGSALFGIIGRILISFYEWRMVTLIEKLSLFIEENFQKRLEKLSHTVQVDSLETMTLYNQHKEQHDGFSHDALAYRKLIELSDQVSNIKNNFFAASNNNGHKSDVFDTLVTKIDTLNEKETSLANEDILRILHISQSLNEKVDTISKLIGETFENVQNDLKIRDQGLSQQLTDQLKKIRETSEMKHTHISELLAKKIENTNLLSDNEDIVRKLDIIEKNQKTIFQDNIDTIATETKNLKQQNETLQDDIRSLRDVHNIQSTDIKDLKIFLSDEIKKIQIDRAKPLMFMPVEATDVNKNTHNSHSV